MFKKFYGISFKLTFFILFFSAIIFVFTLWFNYGFSKKTIEGDIKESAANLTLSTSNQIDKILLSAMNICENFALTLEDTKYNTADLNMIIKSIVYNNDEIFGCCVALAPVNIRSDSTPQYIHYYKKEDTILYRDYIESHRYSSADWYNIPKITHKNYWTEPYNDNKMKIEQVSYSVPFYKYSNKEKIFAGVVSVDISLDWIQKYCASIKILKTGYAFLLSSKRNYISHPFKEYGTNEDIYSIAKKYNDTQYINIGKAMMKGDTGIAYYKGMGNNYDGRIFYTPLSSTPWFLGLFLPDDELLSNLNNLNKILIAISLLGLIILFIVITLISSKITRPLKDLVKVTEKVSEGNFSSGIRFIHSRDEVGLLSRSFSKMQDDLRRYLENLKITTAAKEKIESELQIAREIQMSIVPHKFPPFPDRKDFDLHAILKPAKAVGGDLYDYFFIDPDHLCIAIGDVSGKGVPASLFMAGTEMLLRAKSYKVLPVNTIVKSMNILLYENNDSKLFVTLFAAILDLKTGILQYFNAGHNPPYILKNNAELVKLSETHSPPLGILNLECDDYSTVKIESGDQLILYTDGLTEAMNSNAELFTEKRLENTINNTPNCPSKLLIDTLLESVQNFTGNEAQFDDLTIVSIKYHP
jgi:phosphoserine phosphatase RsbU/P